MFQIINAIFLAVVVIAAALSFLWAILLKKHYQVTFF
jgi:hypothetical protein